MPNTFNFHQVLHRVGFGTDREGQRQGDPLFPRQKPERGTNSGIGSSRAYFEIRFGGGTNPIPFSFPMLIITKILRKKIIFDKFSPLLRPYIHAAVEFFYLLFAFILL